VDEGNVKDGGRFPLKFYVEDLESCSFMFDLLHLLVLMIFADAM